jgi:hypothetical protein
MKRARTISGALALLGFALLALGLVIDATRTLYAYLAAYAFGVSLALGGLLLLMLGHASKASWMVVTRRISEAVAGTLPVFALLFLPIAFGVRRIYVWAGPLDAVDAPLRELLVHKRPYLNVPFFLVRAALCFALFIGIAEVLRRGSLRADRDGDLVRIERMRRLSGAAFPPVAFGITFAAFDWLMSLDPAWYSTMYGFYFFAGAFVGAVALVSILLGVADHTGAIGGVVTPEHTHAVGRVLLTFVIFWAYIAYGQLIIVWIADIPEEVTWYASRSAGSWTGVTYALVFGHFIIPFFILLSRSIKRRPASLAVVGAWIVCAHLLDVYWLVLPALYPDGARPSWLDLAALLAVCGTAAVVGIVRYAAAPPLPTRAPELRDGLRYEAAL